MPSRNQRNSFMALPPTPPGQATPYNPSLPVNTQQVQEIIKNSNEKDLVFYEYEIVNKDAEERLGGRIARQFGYCLCRRWLFILIGNMILVGLTISTCGILLYVNTVVDDPGPKPLGYLVSCTSGTNNCDSVARLQCSGSQCVCQTNMIWNGTDCDCVTLTQYFDGQVCQTRPGYGQSCAYYSCYPGFTCDTATSTCLCSSAVGGVYTTFYSLDLSDIYSGTCQTKFTQGVSCASYGVKACQEYKGLTCSLTSGLCACPGGYYWSTASSICKIQITTYGQACPQTGSCATNQSLTCTGAVCTCATGYFYNTNTLNCTAQLSYMSWCDPTSAVSWCSSALGLTCYNSYPTNVCNCPTASNNNYCDCSATANKYWTGTTCATTLTSGSTCTDDHQCQSGLYCDSSTGGTKTCRP